MTKEEYVKLQDTIADKINNMKYRKNTIKYNEGFKNGLLVAKSILHAQYNNEEVI
jgi:hypothetical protein